MTLHYLRCICHTPPKGSNLTLLDKTISINGIKEVKLSQKMSKFK